MLGSEDLSDLSLHYKLVQSSMAQKILDLSDTLSTTAVLINGYVIKLSLNICIYTHKLVLFSTFFFYSG